jgi:predicted phage-related endonuclease
MNAVNQALIAALTNSVVDELGNINEQIKALEARAKELKEHLANSYGEGAFAGAQFSAKITLSQRNTLDGKALAAELNATPEQLKKFTKVTSVITVKNETIPRIQK